MQTYHNPPAFTLRGEQPGLEFARSSPAAVFSRSGRRVAATGFAAPEIVPMKTRLLIAIVLVLPGLNVLAQEPEWIGTWGASPEPPSRGGGPFPATPSFENETIRQIVRLSAGGEALRLRLTNEHGSEPLRIGAARVALVDEDGELRAGTERVVTFSGAREAVIPAGAPMLSDTVELAVDDLATLSVSLYLPEATGPCTCHSTGLQTAYVSEAGDFTEGTFEPAETLQARAFLSGVEVRADADAVIVALGDSITDGVGSTPGANRRWPDLLAERLAERGRYGVVNHGISGNRVLNDGAGDSALARFDRDVLSVAGATHVIVFEGVNDIGAAYGGFGDADIESFMPSGVEVSEASLIAGYEQLIARARAAGLEIYGATIAPYGGATYYSAEGEAVREAVNAWIRDSGAFDAVLDFDAVLRDPERPTRMQEELHSGDNLHGSDAGYEALAESIDPELF